MHIGLAKNVKEIEKIMDTTIMNYHKTTTAMKLKMNKLMKHAITGIKLREFKIHKI
jgi:hypothetical protein